MKYGRRKNGEKHDKEKNRSMPYGAGDDRDDDPKLVGHGQCGDGLWFGG